VTGLPQDAGRSLLAGGPVTALLFDYGLTLVRFERPVEALAAAERAIAAKLAGAGHPTPLPGVLRATVHDRVEAAVAAHESLGALEELDVAELERRAFADIGLALDDQLLDACSVLVQEAWWRGVHLYPDSIPTLRVLREAGLRTGLCSNAPYRPASMHAQLAHLGLDSFLDGAVFSAETGWRKPSSRLFVSALRALGARAEETVFVGDRVHEDIAGAAASGMRTVLIDRNRSAQQQPLATPPDAVIGSLSELPALVVAGGTSM
jgi:HAD superfamily hydrolase (TIGR01509 family)